MQVRPYQVDFIDSIIKEVSTSKNVCAQLPTGGGKTICFSLIAQKYYRNQSKSVLVLVHREELMYQAARVIKDMLNIDAWFITSKTNRFYVSRVYIGMIESTIPRLNMIDNVGLVIIDECHIANFNKVHNIFPEKIIIGFSATPLSSSKLKPLNKYYQNIITGPQIKELITGEFLAQNITRCPKNIVDATKFKIDKLKGDYDETQMAAEYKRPKFIQNVVKNYFKFTLRKKTIVFNVNIEHSKLVNECFLDYGYNSRHLDSTSPDRKEILQWFRETPDAVLNNVMIATVGFDEPTIQNVFLNFSTLSLAKFIQCCGRGSRALPNKNYFNIIDLGGNCMRFGDWNDDRDWKYLFNNPGKPGNGNAPIKICPQCEGLIPASVQVCTLTLTKAEGELCLYEFGNKKTLEEQELEMVVITKGINVEELIDKNNSNIISKLNKKMKWKIKNGLVVDQEGMIVATLPDNSKEENERVIRVAPEAIEAIRIFVDRVNSGTFKPRSAVKEFEKILEIYNH
ncbi:MAG: DEAD/DEAH box helicase family protein [Ginsengibacter sp.]